MLPRRRKPTPRSWTKARISRRNARCTGCWLPATGYWLLPARVTHPLASIGKDANQHALELQHLLSNLSQQKSLLQSIPSFSPVDGGALTLKAFVVVALGGLGSAWAALAGGLILGIAEVVGGAWIGISYSNLISFAILVLILVVRPSGVLGRRSFATA
jgi:VIT1/CCC1 family predicted Fe2+/Mn2+ transporter